MARDELTVLLEQAACRLSGYPVSVRWHEPARADARAVCYKSGDRAVIDLHPSYLWDGDTLLYVIAHESAHIKELFRDWVDLPDLPSGSIRLSTRALNSPVVVEMESKADTQAHEWLAYAKDNMMRYIRESGGDGFLAELRALINYGEKR